MTDKKEIISLIDSMIRENKEYYLKVVLEMDKNPENYYHVADANFMNGFMCALRAVKDKVNFLE